jgi:MFS family permease
MMKNVNPLAERAFIILVAGSLVLTFAMGIRQTFGLFVAPYSIDRAWPIATFAFAIALQNLMWGLAQPFAGALSDKYGAPRVVMGGGVLYALGLAWTSLTRDSLGAVLGGGILVGLGMSAVSFSVILGAIGRVTTPEKRSSALGLASAGGSFGQMAVVPVAQGLIENSGIDSALLWLSAMILLVVPLAFMLATPEIKTEGASSGGPVQISMSEALREAGGHYGYRLLTLGFFVCGFQLIFISTHLPGYLALCHQAPNLSAQALAAIGFFNMIGSWACGQLGRFFRPKRVLALIYFLRAIAIIIFLYAPKNDWTVLLFASAMGLLWLGTVPLTSGLIATVFGPRYMGTLFGIVFLSHQVGSFFGAWLGGYFFDILGSYDGMWMLTAFSGVAAALIHLPITDQPLRQPA